MARIELAPEIADDFDRIFDHLFAHGVADVPGRIADIVRAIDVLESSPLMGRPARDGRRGEHGLVIGRGARGYVALYRYLEAADTVFVLAIRSQREAGYYQD